MNNAASDLGDSLIVSAKMPLVITRLIESVLREHPNEYPNKSCFVRKAIIKLLKDLGYPQGADVSRSRVDAIYDDSIHQPSSSYSGSLSLEGKKPPCIDRMLHMSCRDVDQRGLCMGGDDRCLKDELDSPRKYGRVTGKRFRLTKREVIP